MNFSEEKKGEIFIEKINLKRPSAKEAGEFKTLLLSKINNSTKKILIDLSDCEYMNSSFLGTIIFIYKTLSESGGQLKLVTSNTDIKILLEITGVDKLIEAYGTKKEALKSFKV
jgi:anti-anti-sigma factor